MNQEPQYIVRLACNDLSLAMTYYQEQGFKTICTEESTYSAWIKKEDFILCISESAADSPALIGYWDKPDEAISLLEQLGIVFNFSADSMGEHFEAHFTDPAGMPIIIADSYDLPKEINIEGSLLKELSIPSTNSFQDSVNFWNSIGFQVQPGAPQPHPWAVLRHGNMNIGIHQAQNWEVAALTFDKKNCPFDNSEIEHDFKVYNHLGIGQTADGCRFYSLGT